MLLGENLELGHAGHGPVVVHDLTDHARLAGSSHAGQVHGAFGLAAAHEHAAVLGPQGEDVAGSVQIRGLGIRCCGGLDRAAAVCCTDTRGHACYSLDRDREGRFEGAGVVTGLGFQLQLVANGAGHGHTDQPTAFPGHEVHGLWGDELGQHGQIALVFTIGVVDQNDHFALAEILEGFGDGGDSHETGALLRLGWVWGPDGRNDSGIVGSGAHIIRQCDEPHP